MFDWASWFGVATVCWIFFSIFLILYCCSDPSAPGPLGLATGLVYLIVELAGRGLRRVFGHRLSNAAFSLWFYLFKRANPILQVVYLVLVNGGWVLFWIHGQSKYIPKESIHHAFIDLTLLANFVSFMLCSTSNPGVVTRENAPQLVRMFPYDNQLYLPKVMCPTCVVEKPARSKHCSYCDRCVMKFDHHCVWVNNDIGLGNYRYFLWFLYQHVWFCSYGAYLCQGMLARVIAEKDLWHVQYRDPASGAFVASDVWFVFQYITYYHGVLWGLLMLLVVMALVLAAFAAYHTYLSLTNATTNERSKAGWISKGVNVHSHHEIFLLTPHYAKIQGQLREMNQRIVAQAYTEAGRTTPPHPTAQSDAAAIAQAKLVAAAASAAATAVANNAAAPAVAATEQKTAAAGVDFPPAPYSPALQALMREYHALKREVVATYEKLQRLQQQEFADEASREKFMGAAPSVTAAAAAAPAAAATQADDAKTSALRAQAASKGLQLGSVETTEGCVPTSAGAAVQAAASSSPAESASAAPAPASPSGAASAKPVRAGNPYSLGLWGNLMQLLSPPKPGDVVPLATTRVKPTAKERMAALQQKKRR